jgi:NAD(P)-dependent dehydrogenase (short-subunit alcohol dehydrogenase family)
MAEQIALVTGANRGLGLETSRQLAQQGIHVILSSRDAVKGEAAVEKLKAEGLTVSYHPLDVADSESIKSLAQFIQEQFGHLEILVNNAGIFIDSQDSAAESIFQADLETLRRTYETNVYGPLQLCQTLIPLMQKQGYGRVVNVSSGMGQLSNMNGGSTGYRLSKTSLNAVTRIFADELKGTNILVNSVCPGWVRTDMGGPNAHRNIEDGVNTIVWLATLPTGSPTGLFFRDRQPIPW